MEELFELAKKSTATTGASMPLTWAELFELYENARVSHCGCCLVGHPLEDPQLTSGRPAESDVQAMRHVQESQDLQGLQESGRPALPVSWHMLPVPHLLGDRQLKGSPVPAWAPLEEVARYFEDGRARDAWVILVHAGRSLPVEEIPDVVEACRAASLQEAADTVLHYAGQRDKESVLRLLRLLLAKDRSNEVNLVLRAALGDDAF